MNRAQAPAARSETVCLLALLLCGAAGLAQAGLFDDEEARKQIAAEKKRIDDLSADLKTQQQAVDARGLVEGLVGAEMEIGHEF